VIYLRRFPKLEILNLAGNPIGKLQEYRPYILAHVNNLRYVDYRLVDETAVSIIQEQM
jgi:hypothetical protein